MTWLPNPGTGEMPAETAIWAVTEVDGERREYIAGRRPCHVRLFGDPARGLEGYDSQSRAALPWPATTTDWRIRQPSPHPFNVKEFEPQ